MSNEVSIFAAFLVGLFGSVHCIGMCGGIVGVLTAGTLTPQQQKPNLLPYHLLYNSGRILSYGVAGFLAGLLGSQTKSLPFTPDFSIAPFIIGVFMILLGGYISGWWRFLTILESWGSHLWKHLQPLSQRFLPIKKHSHALMLGLLWGWLPCGLVYSTLAWALTSANAIQGASLMIAFGLGTAPVLLSMGVLGEQLLAYTRRPKVRQFAGLLIILFGIATILLPTGAQHSLP